MRRINGPGGAVHAPPDFPAPERINALTELSIGELRQAWPEVWRALAHREARLAQSAQSGRPLRGGLRGAGGDAG